MNVQLAASPPSEGRTAADLLDAYRPGDFFFASPRGTLLASGTTQPLLTSVDAVDTALATADPDAVVVGAIPFAPNASAALSLPMTVQRCDRLRPAASRPVGIGEHRITPDPEPSHYVDAVYKALRHIKAGDVTKVVLARRLLLNVAEPIDIPAALRSLAHRDPRGHSFAVDLPGRTLIGASPELLVARDGSTVTANPLAGSAARCDDPIEDGRRATMLLRSAKDRREHAAVVDAIVHVLRPLCTDIRVPAEPQLLPTATMWHLASPITARLRDPATSSLRLATALHPTPAVCGVPTDRARGLISELEPFDRGFYAGMVGWCDARGDGEWVVTIRCGEVDGNSMRLYAGAGIVSGSQPEAELAETTAKFRTLLLALGLGDAS
jgi:isochorismate synthase